MNDLRDPDSVVTQIIQSGGRAVGCKTSAERGEEIVQTAMNAFGRVDVVVNNAGLLRDKAFHNMAEVEWDIVLGASLNGTYAVTKAAWPHFVRQRYGKVINITSMSGL